MGPFMISVQRVKWCLVLVVGICFLGNSTSVILANPEYGMKDFESFPISIIENSAKPQVLINASKDHQLFFKAYNDYSDLDDDNIPETTYKHSINYYGYFDSQKCYTYDTTNTRFEPKSVSLDKYCNAGDSNDEWSGNFLNWASMTRIDAIRKILFGGHRRVDTTVSTVLERAFIPPDIHAFAKYYDRADLPKLTPFTADFIAEPRTSNILQNITVGSKVFPVTDPELWCRIGDYVKIVSTVNIGSTGSPASFMEGKITAIDSVNENITVNVTTTGGSEPSSSWDITNNSIQPKSLESNTADRPIATISQSFTFATDDPTGTYILGDYVAVEMKPTEITSI